MNSLNLAARRTQALASRRFFSKVSSIPTSSAANVDGVKVVGLPHLSVSDGLRLLGPIRSVPLKCSLNLPPHLIFNYLQTSSMKWAYRQKHWLSDPGSYPLIAILAGAGMFCTGFGFYFLTTAPDVQISPLKR